MYIRFFLVVVGCFVVFQLFFVVVLSFFFGFPCAFLVFFLGFLIFSQVFLGFPRKPASASLLQSIKHSLVVADALSMIVQLGDLGPGTCERPQNG